MVNEISSAGPRPTAVAMPAAGSVAVRAPADASVSVRQDAEVSTRHATFAALAGAKDDAAHVAQSARQVGRFLDGVESTVRAMQDMVQQFPVKNFPPFPPGSEQRLDYLNSINALRRQLEAMMRPPLEGKPEPVFYPRESELPQFDPRTASDADIRSFGQALDGMAARLDTGHAQLRDMVRDLPGWIPQELPPPPDGEPQARQLSRTTAEQLSRSGAALLGADAALTQLRG